MFRFLGREIAAIRSSLLTRAGVVAILVIPLLYAGTYLWAFWNPTANLSSLPVAIVNEDVPATVAGTGATGGTKTVDAGADLSKTLVDDGSFDWQATSEADARAGLADGRYYFAVVIPSDFSASIASAADAATAKRASFTLLLDDASTYITSTVAQRAVGEVRTTLAEQIGTQDVEALLAGIGDAQSGIAKAADGAAALSGGAADLSNGTTRVADGAATLADGTASLSNGAATLATGASSLDGGAAKAAAGAATLADGTATLSSGTKDLATAATTLAAGTNTLPAQTRALADGAGTVASGTQSLAAALTAMASNPALDPTTAAQLSAMAQQASALAAGADQVAAGTRTLAAAAPTISSGTAQLAAGAGRLADGATSAASGASALAAGTAEVASGASTLSSGASALADGARSLASGASSLASGASSAADGASKVASGASTLSSGLSDAVASSTVLSADQQSSLAGIIASPVDLESSRSTGLDLYGIGFAPYFIGLSLWVGGVFSLGVLRPVARRKESEGLHAVRRVAAGFAILAGLAAAQAVALITVLHLGLGLNPAHPAEMVGFMVLTAVAFAALLQALHAVVGAPGRLIAVVFLILQLAASAGTYPIETAPAFFRAIHPFMPLTWVIAGLRHLILGGSMEPVQVGSAVLGGIAIVSLLVTWGVTRLGREKTAALDLSGAGSKATAVAASAGPAGSTAGLGSAA